MSTSRRWSTARRSARLSCGQDQLGARPVELRGEAADLPLDLVDDALGGFPLALEVAQLVVDVVHLALQPLLLLLQPVPLGPDFLQPAPALLEVGRRLGVRGGERSRSGERGRRSRTRGSRRAAESDAAWQTAPPSAPPRRPLTHACRCRPTLTRLPPQTEQHPEQHESTMCSRPEEDEAGEGAPAPVAEEQIARVAESQRRAARPAAP